MVLARDGFSSQQTDQPIPANRPDDLYEATSGDYGAHGEFDACAKSFSLAWWLSKNRAPLLGAFVLVAAGGLAAYASFRA